MYDYYVKNCLPTDKPERKVTQLAVVSEPTVFSSYYLWYLIDGIGFKIESVKSILTFTATDCFNGFVTDFIKRRQDAELEGKSGKAMFYKIALNCPYGYDAMNTANYSKGRIVKRRNATDYQHSNCFKDMLEIDEDTYVVSVEPERYRCNTCIQEAFFTLDNAKYWYLVFMYDFMNRCLNVNRFHFIEGDTDSMYFAIAGNPNEPDTRALKGIITDRNFYNNNIFKFVPSNLFVGDETRCPVLATPRAIEAHEKKLLGLAVEKQGDNMIALCAKCYSGCNGSVEDAVNRTTVKAIKCKDANTEQNPMTSKHYHDVLTEGTTFSGQNINLCLRHTSGTEPKRTAHTVGDMHRVTHFGI